MRRRKNYFVKGEKRDLIGVFLHNSLASGEAHRRRREAERQDVEHREKMARRREEKAAHSERLRQEDRLRKAFERADDVLLKYRLTADVTPWVMQYMAVSRCTLRHVEDELLKPLAKGIKTVTEVIEALAVDVEQDGSTRDDQITLLFDWYNLAHFARPALMNYFVESGLSLADIEEGIAKPLADNSGSSVSSLFDAILENDPDAELEPFVAQILSDHGLSVELITPVCALIRNENLTLLEVDLALVPQVIAQIEADQHEHDLQLSAFHETMDVSNKYHWFARLGSAAILLGGAAWYLPHGWFSGIVAAIIMITLGGLLPKETTETSIGVAPGAAVLAVLTAKIFSPRFGSVAIDISLLISVAFVGILIARWIEDGLERPADKRRNAEQVTGAGWQSLVQEARIADLHGDEGSAKLRAVS